MSEDNRKLSTESTLAALLRDKPKRGRPPSSVNRQSVYVALSAEQKKTISTLAGRLPGTLVRADVPDMAVMLFSVRFEQLRDAMADRARELPEGVTDLQSLYYLWDIPLPQPGSDVKWTSIRLSPQQVVQFGRLQGTFNAIFGANRSHVFALALALLVNYIEETDFSGQSWSSVNDFEQFLVSNNQSDQ
ncbi:MAG: hypothetical protein M9918_21670 [Anaerolineae bacterium]|nr:hypothetical protein [Anaerolineae bacterium]MCO5191800.1 hypothetical protein [Anaerolineae bacterium]